MSIVPALLLLMSPEAPFSPAFARPDALVRFSSTSEEYAECISLVASDPNAGSEGARTWMFDGGGAPAMHCVAVADLALGRPRVAAVRLLEIADRQDAGDADARASVLAEAALAWLDAREFSFAVEAIEAGRGISPTRSDLAIVAAKVYGAAERWQDAADAVTIAEEAGAQTAEAYLIRSRAMRALGKMQASAEDVVRALTLDPFDLDALVMRGELIQAGVNIEANYRRPDDPAPKAAAGIEEMEFSDEGAPIASPAKAGPAKAGNEAEWSFEISSPAGSPGEGRQGRNGGPAVAAPPPAAPVLRD